MTQPKVGWDVDLMASVFEKEATYDAGKTHTASTSCAYRGFEFEAGIADVVTSDKDEVTGKEHGYDQEITAYMNSPTLKFPKVRPNDLAGFAALVLGSVTANQDGAYTAYRHRIVPVTAGSALPSISLVANYAGVQTEFKGVKGNTMKLSGEAGGLLSAEFGLIGSGTRATNAASIVAAITESWLRVDMCKFWLETDANISIAATPTQGTEDISSATPDDLSARGLSFEFNWDNGGEGQPGFGGGGVYQDVIYNRRSATFRASINFVDATEIAYFTAQSVCAIELDFKSSVLIDPSGSFYYGAHLVIPRAKIKAYPWPKGGVNDKLTQDFEFDIYDDGTNSAVIMDVYTAKTAYLAAP